MKNFRDFKLSIEHVWAATALIGIFIFVSTHPIRPQDFWWHMAIGREIVTSGQIPMVDEYSYTMSGQPYPAYQVYWLMEVVLYSVYKVGGGALVVFLQSVLISGAYGILLWLCYLVSKSWRIAAFSVLFATALGLNDWNVRPQAVTFLLGALILLAINRLRLTQRKIWLVVFPIVMAVWANSHGTFSIGLLLIGAWWLDEAWICYRSKGNCKKCLLLPTSAGLLGALACLLTPQGVEIIKYLRTMTGSPVIQNLVTEWAAPSYQSLGGSLFFIGLVFSACILAVSPKRPSSFQILLFIFFALLGLKTMRGVVWFGIVMAPILAEHMHAIITSYLPGKQDEISKTGSVWLNRIFISGLLLAGFVSLPWFKQVLPLPPLKAGIYSNETPFDATKFLLSAQLPNPLFNAMSFGSYLIWEAQPSFPVFIDPRIDLYDARTIIEYMTTSSAGEGWQEILDQYGIQTIMASPQEQAGLIEALDNSQSWIRIYTDEAAVIFGRK